MTLFGLILLVMGVGIILAPNFGIDITFVEPIAELLDLSISSVGWLLVWASVLIISLVLLVSFLRWWNQRYLTKIREEERKRAEEIGKQRGILLAEIARIRNDLTRTIDEREEAIRQLREKIASLDSVAIHRE